MSANQMSDSAFRVQPNEEEPGKLSQMAKILPH
jgi:hypothetical protein